MNNSTQHTPAIIGPAPSKPVLHLWPAKKQCGPSITSSLELEDCLSNEEKYTVFPKRFSRSRDDYYTTNTNGEVVKILNPKVQFKSKLLKSSVYDPSESVIGLCCSDKHSTKSYSSIPEIVDNAQDLRKCCTELSEKSDKSLKSMKHTSGVFIERYLRRIHHPNELSFYQMIHRNSARPKKDRKASKFRICHMYHMIEWPRVRSIIMDIIECYRLGALLSDTFAGYHATFPNSSARYLQNDRLISSTILSFIHIQMFDNSYQEKCFNNELKVSQNKTKMVLQYMNKKFRGYYCNSLPYGVLYKTIIASIFT